jgi:hypothetical protein
MRKAYLVVACFALLSVGGCKRKLKLEGKVTGFKPGTDTLMLHVVSERGAYITCQPPGYGCKTIDIGAGGTADVELETQAGQNEKKVYLKGKIGPAENAIVVDPAASMPPAAKVSFNKYIECVAKDCSGTIDVIPTARISLKAPAGTVVEIGTDKLTVGASGQLDAPFNSSPAAKDQPLAKLFDNKTIFGSSNLVLTFPDKTKLSTKFDLSADGASTTIGTLVKGAASGPVLFPWEKGPPPKGKAVALYCRGFCTVGGATDATWAELRVVAFSEEKGQRKTTCSYTQRSTGKAATANLTMHDLTATAYERATGRKLGTKVFEASNVCDSEVSGSLTAQDSYPFSSVIAQWAAGFAR